MHVNMFVIGAIAGLAPSEFEARMVEYVKLLNKELRSTGTGTPPPMIHRHASSPPNSPPPRVDPSFSALEMSRLTLWNMYNNNSLYPGVGHPPPQMSPLTSHSPNPQASSPEPQREALDLGLRSSPLSVSSPTRHSPTTSGGTVHIKKDKDFNDTGPTAPKRPLSDNILTDKSAPLLLGANIKITNRDKSGNGDNSLSVSVELNGITYQGVLFAQADSQNATNTTNNNNKPRSMVS